MEDETIVGTEETLAPQEEVVEVEEESIEEVKARLSKAEELAKNYKIRAEKAESKTKEEKPTQTNTLSAADILAVAKAGIEPEDLEDVVEYAEFKKIPLHEALKSSVVKATLAEKAELRKSAEATNTGNARRASTTVSDDQLIHNARKGILPSSDEDIARVVRLRLQKK